MTMTRFEAEDRAKRIWPADAVDDLFPGDAGMWYVCLAGDGRLHMMDGNGHTICHEHCARSEEKLP